MYAAAGIIVREFTGFWKMRSVGMTADKHSLVLYDPYLIILFNLMSFIEIFGGTGRTVQTYYMQKTPDISKHEHGNVPELIIHKVTLMTMDHKYFLAGFPVFEYNGFMWD